jgi:hypothetical protein
VAEALLAESDAKAPSIERRLERFLSNEKIDPKVAWDELLAQVMPYFRQAPMQLVIDVTPYEEHAEADLCGPVAAFTRLAADLEGDAGTGEMGSRLLELRGGTFQATRASPATSGLYDHRRQRLWMLCDGAFVSEVWMALPFSHL